MAANRSWWIGCILCGGLACIAGIGTAAENAIAKELAPAWSLDGQWFGVVGDENERVVYALRLDGKDRKCVELDSTGKTRREFALPKLAGSSFRLANWTGDGGRALLTFSRWQHQLHAYNLRGEELWSYDVGQGIDDVWATNLHDEKSSDVIVGYEGKNGLHVLDSRGRLRWKSSAIGTANSVCAGDLLGEGTLQVVTTSDEGIRVFGSDGAERKKLDTGNKYATMVRIGKLSEKQDKAMIFVDGMALSADGKQALQFVSALSGDGAKQWTLELGASNRDVGVNSAMLAPGKPWLAIGMNSGQVYVIDAENGTLIVSVNGKGAVAPEVGWVMSKADGKPLLLVANGGKLNAFRVPQTK